MVESIERCERSAKQEQPLTVAPSIDRVSQSVSPAHANYYNSHEQTDYLK